MSLVPGSRFPSHPYQGPQYYPPKHMRVLHATLIVYVNSTPAVVVLDYDDYTSFVNVNLAGGSVAGSAVANSNSPTGGLYSYGASIAAGATLGSIATTSSVIYGINYEIAAYVTIVDTVDTAAEEVVLTPDSGVIGSMLQTYVGAAAGASEASSGSVFMANGIYEPNYSWPILENRVATTANCTIYLSALMVWLVDFIPGPEQPAATW